MTICIHCGKPKPYGAKACETCYPITDEFSYLSPVYDNVDLRQMNFLEYLIA